MKKISIILCIFALLFCMLSPVSGENEFLYGDMNADGKITTSDALVSLQKAVGKIELSSEQERVGDVDADGGVTTRDALLILQRAVRLIVHFPIQAQGEIEVYKPKAGGVWYPRMYTLKDGTMLCGFDTNEDGGRCVIKLVRSSDGGLTWSSDAVTASLDSEYDCANAAFIEVDGLLLCGYRANVQTENGYYSSIRISQSADGGVTWTPHSLVIEEYGTGGVYEPHFHFVDGKLAVFYANDSRNGAVHSAAQQNIEMRIFSEGTWKEKHIACLGIEHRSRDGMPVVDRLSDGTYIMAIEATNVSGYPFVIQLFTSENGYEWEKKSNLYIPNKTGKKAGAPYVATLPDGRIAVSFQTDEDYEGTGDGYSCMKTLISKQKMTKSSDFGIDSFDAAIKPFATPEGHCSVWNGLAVDGGYLFQYTSTNYPYDSIRLVKTYIG